MCYTGTKHILDLMKVLLLSLLSLFLLANSREIPLGDRNVYTQKLQRNYLLRDSTIEEFAHRQNTYLKMKYLGVSDENVTLKDFQNAQYTMPIAIGTPKQTFNVSQCKYQSYTLVTNEVVF